jgi:coiled-coil domain-containing protein 55
MLQKKQVKMMQQQAMEEDPSIFQYDEVYDDIQNKRKEEKEAKKTADAKKPRYIGKLLETAEKRKKEYERRIERQVQKEREAEGEEFKDKESFVTSSYRKKLEEMKEADELEKREAYLESIGDVTRQQDLSGFYRHLYSQKLGTDEKPKEETEESKSTDTTNKKKNYRKRKSSAEEEEEIEIDKKKADHLPCNLDADSDFSIESSDSEDESEKKKESSIKEEVKTEEEKDEMPPPATLPVEVKEEEIKVEPPKVKVDIWKKRTVGEVFDQALQRYFERKAAREQNAY